MRKELLQLKLVKTESLKKLMEEIDQKNKAIENATRFIKEIEKGNLEAEYVSDHSIENDTLSESLIKMRDQMRTIAKNERERSWSTEGLAKFVDILRSSNDDLKSVAEHILSNLVKYMELNQGALFLLNDNNTDDQFLELYACYAYERKKFINRRVAIGEGLTGQAYLEKETIYMTKVPENYINITSGLGNASPKNILIVPLKVNEEVYGVLELASFTSIPQYRIDFVEKLGESIASTLSTVKINHKTKILLLDSQQQAETLRAQEEEMRQNVEELSATQEEMQRVMREVQGKEGYLNHLLNVSKEAIYTLDKNYRIINFNSVIQELYKTSGVILDKGFNILDTYKGEDRVKQKAMFDDVLKGKSFEFVMAYPIDGKEIHHSLNISPLISDSGEIFGIANFAKDVTEFVESQRVAEKMLIEAQHQAEETKAQEEELRQNMEELSSTQEEMERLMRDVQAKESFMTDLINASNDSIITIDKDFKIISCNSKTYDTYKAHGLEVGKGFDILDLFIDEQKIIYKGYYERALKGESFEITENYKFGDKEQYFAVTYSPLKNDKGEIIGAAVFGKDISETMFAKLETEKALNRAQQQQEEMKAQEEELRQNMEELSTIQEEMQRILDEVKGKERYMDEVMNASKDSIFTIDKNYKIISFNKSSELAYKASGVDIEKGYDTLSGYDEKQKKEEIKLYSKVFAGEEIEVIREFNIAGKDVKYILNYSPLINEKGEIYAAAVFGKDITGMVTEVKK